MAKNKNPTRFTVRGGGRFPIDMLRYDACWPASSEDAHKIESAVREPKFDVSDLTEIALTIAPGYSEPTTARWQSFGWMVMQ